MVKRGASSRPVTAADLGSEPDARSNSPGRTTDLPSTPVTPGTPSNDTSADESAARRPRGFIPVPKLARGKQQVEFNSKVYLQVVRINFKPGKNGKITVSGQVRDYLDGPDGKSL